MTTSATDKKHLRRLGHNLKPVVTIATKGLTDTVNAEIDRALNESEDICDNHGAELIQSIGHMLLIFRAAKKPNPKLSNLLRQ